MIINFQADPVAARPYSVVCARTGENLDHWHIWYADDAEGVVKCYVKSEHGGFLLNDARDEAVTETIRKAIKIVLKPAALREAEAEKIAERDRRRAECDAVTLEVLKAVVRTESSRN